MPVNGDKNESIHEKASKWAKHLENQCAIYKH